MGNIKPIETRYNGYRFRSRLEAKWAVFFDKAEIPYEYESQGYVLSDGTCYLPDFYLPWFHMYVEIKPSSISDDDFEIAKRKLEDLFHGDCFSKNGNGIVVAIMVGDPYEAFETFNMYAYVNIKRGEEKFSEWRDLSFVKGVWCEYEDKNTKIKYIGSFGSRFIVASVYGREDEQIHNSGYDCNSCIINSDDIRELKTSFGYEHRIARNARFEHGECGYDG